jgi:hypothetical protein
LVPIIVPMVTDRLIAQGLPRLAPSIRHGHERPLPSD